MKTDLKSWMNSKNISKGELKEVTEENRELKDKEEE
jgi:hypothetical protein